MPVMLHTTNTSCYEQNKAPFANTTMGLFICLSLY